MTQVMHRALAVLGSLAVVLVLAPPASSASGPAALERALKTSAEQRVVRVDLNRGADPLKLYTGHYEQDFTGKPGYMWGMRTTGAHADGRGIVLGSPTDYVAFVGGISATAHIDPAAPEQTSCMARQGTKAPRRALNAGLFAGLLEPVVGAVSAEYLTFTRVSKPVATASGTTIKLSSLRAGTMTVKVDRRGRIVSTTFPSWNARISYPKTIAHRPMPFGFCG